LLHGLHFLNDRWVIFGGLVYVALDAVHGSNDIVSSFVIAVSVAELVRVASVLKEVFEATEVLVVNTVSAELDLLVVCEISSHVPFGVAVIMHLTQEFLLKSLEGPGQSSEQLITQFLGLVGGR